MLDHDASGKIREYPVQSLSEARENRAVDAMRAENQRRFIMPRLLLAAAALAVASIALAGAALAQVPTTPPPYNTDQGVVITNTLRTAGTVTSAQEDNLANSGVSCTFVQTAASGSPSTTFEIQGFDTATASYHRLAVSGAITDTTVSTVIVYPGAVATSVPTGMVIAGLPLPRKWRISQTIGGSSGPATTSKIGCNLLR